jgi:hypothetical protein
MANTKLSALTGLATVASGDTLYIVDVSDTTDGADGTSKKITQANLVSGLAASGANTDITSLAGLTTPITVAQGGSGAATLTGILKGNGTSAFTAVTAPSGTIVGTTDSQTLTNKTLTAPVIATISNTGTVTLPTATDTLVGKATTDTLTNKSISGSTNTLTNIGTTAITDAAVTSRKMKLDKIQYVTIGAVGSLSSTSYADLTGLTSTFTPDVASNLLVMYSVNTYNSDVAGVNSFILDLDGADQGNDPNMSIGIPVASEAIDIATFVWITGVTAAEHTLKVQYKVSAGSAAVNYGRMIIIPFAS